MYIYRLEESALLTITPLSIYNPPNFGVDNDGQRCELIFRLNPLLGLQHRYLLTSFRLVLGRSPRSILYRAYISMRDRYI